MRIGEITSVNDNTRASLAPSTLQLGDGWSRRGLTAPDAPEYEQSTALLPMLNSHAALRQCVRFLSPQAYPISTTRHTLPIPPPCLIQQRTRTWLSRLLGTGFNSVKSRKRTAPKRKATKTSAPAGKPPPKSRTSLISRTAEPVAEKGITAKPSYPPVSSIVHPHHDLRSFLRWSSRRNTNTESTSYVGTHYEYTVAKALKQYGFTLGRSGGPNDQGIDLIGHWPVPTIPKDLTILVQCKVSRPTSAVARELEGACSGGRSEWRREGVMAWLTSPNPPSLATWQTIERSPRPMGFALHPSSHYKVILERMIQMMAGRLLLSM